MSSPTQGTQGLLASLLSTNVLIACGIIAAIYLLDFLVAPRLDPREPPLIKPKVPLIGHIIGLLWYQYSYHNVVHDEKPVPIASLQMLWGKIYTIWDPTLVQASLKSRNLSFEPFTLEFAEKAFGLQGKTLKKIFTPGLVPKFNEAIHTSMQPKHVHAMNINALKHISQVLDEIAPGEHGGLTIENMFVWFKDLITFATTDALLGPHNPFASDHSLYNDLWQFEGGLTGLLTKPFPSILARKTYLARGRMQKALGPYYEAKHDLHPDASELARGRANVLREFGFTGTEIGQVDSFLPIVGTTNSAPMMYWMICNLFARPDLILTLREEVLPLISRSEKGDDIVSVDLNRLEAESPLLVSCYRETLRLANYNVSVRRVLDDTNISDGQGRSYLLKKGVDVQIGGAVMHVNKQVWGPDAHIFKPERFTTSSKDNVGDRTKRTAYIPFGGGQHLCPGRNFAFAEILAVSCALVLGFELENVGMAFDDMRLATAALGNATYKPRDWGKGLGVKIRRRAGWENVKWRFKA